MYQASHKSPIWNILLPPSKPVIVFLERGMSEPQCSERTFLERIAERASRTPYIFKRFVHPFYYSPKNVSGLFSDLWKEVEEAEYEWNVAYQKPGPKSETYDFVKSRRLLVFQYVMILIFNFINSIILMYLYSFKKLVLSVAWKTNNSFEVTVQYLKIVR